jgi:hypothetical protein
MRIISFILTGLVITSCNNSNSKTGNEKNTHIAHNQTEENIYRSADSMMAAFKRKDWATFAKYNHPAMAKMMGGPEAFASFINMQMQQVSDTVIKSMQPGKILQVVETDKDRQCVVEENTEMQINGMRILKTTYLIGESLDNGNTWTFLDASTGIAPAAIKKDISPKLNIPQKKQKVEELQ